MTEKEIRKNIDLHHDRIYFSMNKNYIEFYFHACFHDFFNTENSYQHTYQNNAEFIEILRTLNIKIDLEFIIAKYNDQKNHDVEVFHSSADEQVFAYFDLEKEPTDQNDMFFLGISCLKSEEPIIHEMLLNIYRRLGTASPFHFDIWNKRLYNNVFKSYSYFYNNNYHEDKRQMKHHTLGKR